MVSVSKNRVRHERERSGLARVKITGVARGQASWKATALCAVFCWFFKLSGGLFVQSRASRWFSAT